MPTPAPMDLPKVNNFFESHDALDMVEVNEMGVLPTYDSATARQFCHGVVHNPDIDGNAQFSW